jgi:hypothetical protein
MTLLLYAVTAADAEPPEGLAALRGHRAGVVHAEHEAPSVSDRDAVLAFGRTVELITQDGPALPVRYGTTVADLAELQRLVARHEDEWAERLEVVAGCRELLLHLDLASPAEPGPVTAELTGRAYLMRRAEVIRARQALRDEVRGLLRPRLREDRVLLGTGRDRMAVLVPAAEATGVRDDLVRWATAREDVRLEITGPWPPFSFCEALS